MTGDRLSFYDGGVSSLGFQFSRVRHAKQFTRRSDDPKSFILIENLRPNSSTQENVYKLLGIQMTKLVPVRPGLS
jgi:hypothetical protein